MLLVFVVLLAIIALVIAVTFSFLVEEKIVWRLISGVSGFIGRGEMYILIIIKKFKIYLIKIIAENITQLKLVNIINHKYKNA